MGLTVKDWVRFHYSGRLLHHGLDELSTLSRGDRYSDWSCYYADQRKKDQTYAERRVS